MNQRLSERRIRETCREMLSNGVGVTGRGLCAELRKRFGAVGKTTRVFAIWREEVAAAAVPVDLMELRQRVAVAESASAENLARAERAELREEAHQEKWAIEIDRLRMELRAARGR